MGIQWPMVLPRLLPLEGLFSLCWLFYPLDILLVAGLCLDWDFKSQWVFEHPSIKNRLLSHPLPLLNTNFATILGIIYCYLPFMVLPLFAALEKIDYTLVEAAYDLGARPFQAFWRVIWPLSLHGVVAGSMLVLIPAVGEFVIPELLGGSQTLMIGRVLWNEFFTNRDWPVASALAVVMLVFLIIPIAIFQRLQERQVRFLDAD